MICKSKLTSDSSHPSHPSLSMDEAVTIGRVGWSFIHIIPSAWWYTYPSETYESQVGIIVPNMAVCQNLVPLVNIKIAGKWMFIPLKMYL